MGIDFFEMDISIFEVGSISGVCEMKILIVILGLLFAYWNYCGMCENLLAFWHLIFLIASLLVVGLIFFNYLFDVVTAPNYSRLAHRE